MDEFSRLPIEIRPRPSRRRLCATMAAAVAGCVGPASLARASPAADPARTFDAEWTDDARARRVPIRLRWPAAPTGPSSVPLVVFSHGLGGSRESYRYLGEAWAAAGVATLHVQHVGSDSDVWGGNPLGLISRLNEAAGEGEALDRARDLTCALDRFLDPAVNALQPSVDQRRIVAAGHSYGANTTLIALGAGVVRGGRRVEHRDPRFKAGIVVSAPPFYGERDLRAVLGGVDRPTLHVTATDDVIDIPGLYSPAQDRVDVYNAVPGREKAIALFRGGSHGIFTDRTWTGGITLNPKVKAATAEAVPAFLDLTFRGDPAPLLAWDARWRDILAVAPVPF